MEGWTEEEMSFARSLFEPAAIAVDLSRELMLKDPTPSMSAKSADLLSSVIVILKEAVDHGQMRPLVALRVMERIYEVVIDEAKARLKVLQRTQSN